MGIQTDALLHEYSCAFTMFEPFADAVGLASKQARKGKIVKLVRVVKGYVSRQAMAHN